MPDPSTAANAPNDDLRPAGFDQVPIDAVRSYWNARPCNVRHSPKPVGSREYFDEVEARKYFVEPHIPGFAQFESWAGKKVLEVGCGIGTDTMNFARAGATVTAVDLSSESLALARQRAEVFDLDDAITFFEVDAEHLPDVVPVDEYDLVYSFGVLHHTPHPETAIGHIRRYMGSASELRMMVYSRVSYKLFWVMHEEGVWDLARMDELVARNSEAQTGCPVTYTYSPDGIVTLLEGYEVLDVHKDHIFTWDIDAYRNYEYVKDAPWADVSDAQLAELEKELGWHTMVRARLTR
jgi:SAM-dependent methyltransferase